jgi:hypothetical protein
LAGVPLKETAMSGYVDFADVKDAAPSSRRVSALPGV